MVGGAVAVRPAVAASEYEIAGARESVLDKRDGEVGGDRDTTA
jgi:hypothetical protein